MPELDSLDPIAFPASVNGAATRRIVSHHPSMFIEAMTGSPVAAVIERRHQRSRGGTNPDQFYRAALYPTGSGIVSHLKAGTGRALDVGLIDDLVEVGWSHDSGTTVTDGASTAIHTIDTLWRRVQTITAPIEHRPTEDLPPLRPRPRGCYDTPARVRIIAGPPNSGRASDAIADAGRWMAKDALAAAFPVGRVVVACHYNRSLYEDFLKEQLLDGERRSSRPDGVETTNLDVPVWCRRPQDDRPIRRMATVPIESAGSYYVKRSDPAGTGPPGPISDAELQPILWNINNRLSELLSGGDPEQFVDFERLVPGDPGAEPSAG